jgi:hypothetical protein
MTLQTYSPKEIKGGKELAKYLFNVAQRLGAGGVVRVGFLENARYPSQDKTARFRAGVAKLNNVGPRKSGSAAFVSPRKPAFTAPLPVATVAFWNNFGTSRAPARPFFSNMIAEKSPGWGKKLGNTAKACNYDTKLILQRMGEGIQGQLVKAIVDWPADNSPLTVAIKGFNKGLQDQRIMQRHVGYEVVGS